jgi:hypothetical protein
MCTLELLLPCSGPDKWFIDRSPPHIDNNVLVTIAVERKLTASVSTVVAVPEH